MAVLKRKTNNGWESVALPVLDQTPTEGSNRGVTSDGIYKAIAASGAVWGGITGTLSNQTDLQSALDAKQATLTAGTNVSITDNVISATDTTYEPATTSANGLMSSADKTKLDGIEAEATKVTPNPATTTAELTGVTIGGTNYKISGVPDGTAASQGLVWNGTEWQKQDGYGYDNASFDESWDGDVTGKTIIFTNYAKISDTVPVTSVGDSLVCYATNSVGETRGPYTCTVSQLATNILRVVYNPGSGSVDVIMAMADTTYGGQPISKGTYFYFKEDNSYWNSRLIKASTVQFDSRFIPTPSKINYTTTAPTSVNYSGLKIAYLTSEPTTKYDGWLYLIKK